MESLIVQEWRSVYDNAIFLGPPRPILSSANLTFLANNTYATGARGGDGVGFETAAAAIIKFTLATLMVGRAQLVRENDGRKGWRRKR